MIDYREILRLNSLGYSRRRISSMVGSSHHTVDQTLAGTECSGIEWPLDDDITKEELQSICSRDSFCAEHMPIDELHGNMRGKLI